jgi:valyl-tRNA synthetase
MLGSWSRSIATEAKVVAKLKAEGINKNDLTREEFFSCLGMDRKVRWCNSRSIKKTRCVTGNELFTMDPDMSASVIRSFVDLYNKGLIYRDTEW